MNIDVARHTIRTALSVAKELQDLLTLLKVHCDADEYKKYTLGIAQAIDATNAVLLNNALSDYPVLEREIEDQLNRYSRYL
jgi:hypothetical protein